MGKDKNKPRGKMTAYAYFVQTCREEHKKKHPGENVVFAEFSKKCAEKWKSMGAKEKKRFDEMAVKDKSRYEKEMANYTPVDGPVGGKKRKMKKDPNAPKRSLSAFFFFCNEFRAEIKEANPSFGIGDVAKELGHRWEKVGNAKPKYEEMAKKDKARYEKEMAAYKKSGGGASPPKKAKPEPKKKAAPPPVEEDDDEEEEEDEDDEEEEDDEEDDDE